MYPIFNCTTMTLLNLFMSIVNTKRLEDDLSCQFKSLISFSIKGCIAITQGHHVFLCDLQILAQGDILEENTNPITLSQ